MPSDEPRRSGCAVASGVFFILLGTLLLAQNLSDFRLLDYAGEALTVFADYWPALLILWGLYKVYQRFARPEHARVSALEVLTILLFVCVGLAVGMAQRAMEEIATSEVPPELAALFGPDALGPLHLFEEKVVFELASGVSLDVENELGGLRATGSDREDLEVVLEKRVRILSEEEARRIAEGVRFEIQDGTARIVSTRNERVRVDLELRLPRDTKLTARGRQGPVRIVGIDGAVVAEARNDDVVAERLGGSLGVVTRNGDIRIEDVSGDVRAESRRGSVAARELGGALGVETARGSVSVEDVADNFSLNHRHGSVYAARVGGSVEIRAEHTRVEIEDASGAVDVATTHRPIFVRGVGESLRIDARNSPLIARDVRGDVVVENRLQPVRVADVGGSLTVLSPNGAVDVERVSGPVSVEGTHEPVRVSEFLSSLTLRTSHGSLTAVTDRLGGEILLETSYGDIELELPESASFQLSAESRDGELVSGFEGLELVESTDDGIRRWRGSLSGGLVGVRLETAHGDIHVRAVSP